jgi:hypothetical protein
MQLASTHDVVLKSAVPIGYRFGDESRDPMG